MPSADEIREFWAMLRVSGIYNAYAAAFSGKAAGSPRPISRWFLEMFHEIGFGMPNPRVNVGIYFLKEVIAFKVEAEKRLGFAKLIAEGQGRIHR